MNRVDVHGLAVRVRHRQDRTDPGQQRFLWRAASETRDFTVSEKCGAPATAKGYTLNATVVPAGPLSYPSLWPSGTTRPVVSTWNSFLGRVVANAALAPAGLTGSVSVNVPNPTHLILDVNGYFQ